jgi:hypothetical protein
MLSKYPLMSPSKIYVGEQFLVSGNNTKYFVIHTSIFGASSLAKGK